MAAIDINQYIEQSGMRKARFGGYEPDDVRQAMLDLCSEYEQRLNTAVQQVRGAQQEAEALRRRCQTLIGQNQNLAAQNAALAGKADRIARVQSDMETRYSKVQERNHSLTDQVAMLRLKNTDLELKNKELTERAENADAALRIKGREHEQAKQQVLAERDSVVAGAQKEAARIRSQAREEADQLLKDTNLKAEAIDQLAREQAIGQARKMVQAATEETREIQNAHRLRLQDLQSRIDAMEQQRGKLMDFLAKMIGELQETQDYARQNSPQPLENAETTEPSAEPQLDLSPTAVDAAASALRAGDTPEETPAPAPAARRIPATSRATAWWPRCGTTTPTIPAQPAPCRTAPKSSRCRNTSTPPPPPTSCTRCRPRLLSLPKSSRGRLRSRVRSSPTRSYARRASRFWTRNRRCAAPIPRCCRSWTPMRKRTTPSPRLPPRHSPPSSLPPLRPMPLRPVPRPGP